MLKNLALVLSGLLFSLSANAKSCTHEDIVISDVFIKPVMKGKNSTAGYATLHSICSTDMELIGVEVPFKSVVELHDMKHEDGVMKMNKVDSIKIEPNKTVELKKGGMHIMFMDIKDDLLEKSQMKVKFKFKGNISREVLATVIDNSKK